MTDKTKQNKTSDDTRYAQVKREIELIKKLRRAWGE